MVQCALVERSSSLLAAVAIVLLAGVVACRRMPPRSLPPRHPVTPFIPRARWTASVASGCARAATIATTVSIAEASACAARAS